MNNREISRQLAIINDLVGKVDDACGEDFELLSQWAKHICVLVSGFIENSMKEIYRDYIYARSDSTVARYATSKIQTIKNPKAGKIVEIVGSFNSDWISEINLFLDDCGRGDAIDSIMTNRHQIAHGQRSTITLVRVREYLDKAVEVIEYLERQTNSAM